MNVWIDIYHIPQLNFYSQFVKQLSARGYNVFITILDRGKNVVIVKKTFANMPNVKIWTIGKHRLNVWSVIFEANLLRITQLLYWSLFKHVDISFSNGFQHGFIAKFTGHPAYSFHDDPDAGDHKMMNRFCTQNHALLYCLPNGYKLHHKDILMPSLKEWAYLNPRVFSPKIEMLDSYSIKPKNYIFIREVSTGTFNYSDQISGCVLKVQNIISNFIDNNGNHIKVLFSLEEKHRRNEYPEDWILLQEPVDDIHSLIYYSAGLVSSGDSMAREAALLGVPSYYLGIRHSMPANLAASKVANFQNEKTMPFAEWIKTLDVSANEAVKRQEELRAKIDGEFIDINDYMMSLVEKHRK